MKLNPEALIKARAIADLTQDELAIKTGVSITAINQYESGKLNPRKTTIYKLAFVLDVEAESLCIEPTYRKPNGLDDPELAKLVEERSLELGIDKKIIIATLEERALTDALKYIQQGDALETTIKTFYKIGAVNEDGKLDIDKISEHFSLDRPENT